MKGHVATPDSLAERIVRGVFAERPPSNDDRILYPGCGSAPFAAATERLCEANGWEPPTGLGVDTDPSHLDAARSRDLSHVRFEQCDFLGPEMSEREPFDYVVGNPPYVAIEDLDETEKQRYRRTFTTAEGRFDLYLLFFERGLELLADDGWLSFVTPEKFEYVDTAGSLRQLLTAGGIDLRRIEHVDEDAFAGRVTFPCLTTIRRGENDGPTQITRRDGSSHVTHLPADGSSWAPAIRDADLKQLETGVTLGDVTERVSAGVATGADNLFVVTRDEVPAGLERWVRPTVSGKELTDGPQSASVFLCPYYNDGTLAPESELGEFLDWAQRHRERLETRSCVENGKRWYAWHERPPLSDILQPKILFRDIANRPQFWPELDGNIVPRHSVYYAVPSATVDLTDLVEYLNSSRVRAWLEAHCQKAHNGYLRLQSRVVSDLPVPVQFADTYQTRL